MIAYFFIPALSAVTPLLVYPAISDRYGPDGFSSVAIAQSIGLAGGVIAELGWGVIGPQGIARVSPEARGLMYRSSVATKMLALVTLAPVVVGAAALIAPGFKLAAAIIAFSMLCMCLSPSWYLVGLNSPMRILLVEGLPRTVLLGASAIIIFYGAPLLFYGVGVLASVSITLIIFGRVYGLPFWPRSLDLRAGLRDIRVHLPLTLGRTISTVYTTLPTAIVGIVSANSVATFAAADRLLRMATSILGGIPSRLQSWLGVATELDRKPRERAVLLVNALLGLVSGTAFLAAAPWAASLIFANQIHVSFWVAFLAGLIIFVVCASRGCGLILVSRGLANWISLANASAASVGIVAVWFLGHSMGAPGALAGVLLSELAGLTAQIITLRIKATTVANGT